MGKEVEVKNKPDTNWQKQYRRLEIISNFSMEVGQFLELDEIVQTALESLSIIFPSVTGLEIYLWNPEKHLLILSGQRGLPPELVNTGMLQSGEGLAGMVIKNQAPLYITDITKNRKIDQPQFKKEKWRSYCGLLLSYQENPLGVLGLYSQEIWEYSSEDKDLLEKVVSRLCAAIQRGVIYERAAVRARRFIAISRAITVTRQLGTLKEVLKDLSKVLVQSLGYDQSWIGLVSRENTLQGNSGFGAGMKYSTVGVEFEIYSKSSNPAVQAILEQKPVVCQFIDDVADEDVKTWLSKLRVQSFGFIPILTGEMAVGVLGVFFTSDQAFNEEDIKALSSVTEQTAIAIENARLYERIKASEENYRILFEAAGTSLVILNEKEQFRLVNEAFQALSGYSNDELIEKMKLTPFLSGKTKAEIREKMHRPPQNWEAEFVDKHGSVKQVHITTTRIPGSTNILVSLIDMTRERELERKLFRSEELAAIGELSAGIAHEIRNPLVAISTSVSLLKDETEISQEGQQLLDVVKEESNHLAAIVDDFLKYAKPKEPDFQEVNLNQLLIDVIKRYKELDCKKITWKENLEKKLPLVRLDRHQIQQVITNLILNSLDAMKDGDYLKVITQKEKNGKKESVRFSIEDSGIGIPKNELEKIFLPFYSMKEKGTGMGLAICRQIIENHQGEIEVKSEEGKGTVFSILLPLKRESNESDN